MTSVVTDGGVQVDRPPGAIVRRRRGRPGQRLWPLILPVVLLLGVFFVYPTGAMLTRSLTDFDAPQAAGLDNYLWFFQTSTNTTVLIRTVQTAALCTLITAVLAFFYAYTMTLVSPFTRTLMTAAVFVSMFAGVLLRNFAWIVLLQKEGLINDALAAVGLARHDFLGTTTAVLIGMVHVLFPFMLLPLYAVLRGIDRRLVLAAQSLGASPWRAFRQVYLPLASPGLLAGGLLVFVLGLGFFITPALLGSPAQAMVSQLLVLQFDRQAAFGRAGAMAVVLVVVALVCIALASAALRRGRGYEQS